MSLRNLGVLVFGVLGACTYTAPNMLQPAGGGNGGGGTGGDSSTSGNGGIGGGAGGQMPTDWWNPAWAHRVRITFQNADGETLTGFPVMVRVDGSRINVSKASPTGADLRFVDDDGQTLLAHEIDHWAPGGDSFVWVRVPTIDTTNTDFIWLYYGNPTAVDTQDAATVWKGFVGVYHLSPSTDTPTEFADSTGTNPGAWFNDQPGEIVSGPIHDAIELDGARFVHIGLNNHVAADPGEARTAEAWVNTSTVQDQAIVYEEGECVGWYLGMNAMSEYVGSFITDPELPLCGAGTSDYLMAATASTGAWHYVSLVVDRPGLEMRMFIDGTLVTSTSINNTEIADGNGLFRIGSDHDGGAGTFVGAIDEVRVSSSARSAGWIAAQHKSMTDSFLSFNVQ